MSREARLLSLAGKFNALTIGLVVVAIVVLTALALRWQTGWQRDALVVHGEAMARMAAVNAEYGIYTASEEALASTARSVDTDETVAWIAFHDADGDQLHFRCGDCETVPPAPKELQERVRWTEAAGGRFLEITVPVVPDVEEPVEPIGWVRLGIPDRIVEESRREVLTTLAPAAGLLVVLGVLISLALNARLMGPVRELVAATGRVRHGDFDGTVSVPHDAELAQLAVAFNDMLERLAAYRDEVERHRTDLEAAVEERTVSLRNAMEEATELARRAQAANQTKSAFLARMSHELRTPLNAVIGYAEMLIEELDAMEPDDMRRDLDAIGRSGRHLLGLINDVLDLSRVEAGRMPVEIQPFQVSETLEVLLGIARPMAQARGNRLRIKVDGLPGEMMSDETKLRQILLNLLSNACKFTRRGDILLTATSTEEALTFAVRDTGPGIPEDMRDSIFEPFVQVDDSTTREVGGTGLGLPIARRFAEMLGGSLTLQSEVGVGTTFTLELPRRTRVG